MDSQAIDLEENWQNTCLIKDCYPGYTKNCDNSTTERQTIQFKMRKRFEEYLYLHKWPIRT